MTVSDFPDPATPSGARELMRRYEIKAKKRLGQHFLVDGNTARRIAAVVQINDDDLVVEIGPGLGALTQYIIPPRGEVVLIEKDGDLARMLRDTLGKMHTNLQVIEGDALEVSFADYFPERRKCDTIKVVGNLPYNISTPLLTRVLELGIPWKRIVVLVQKEVGQRLTAGPGGQAYGSLSVLIRFYGKPEYLFSVSPNVFYPRPAVESAVVAIEARMNQPLMRKEEWHTLFGVVKAAFQQRRKTVLNALSRSPFLDLDRNRVREVLQVAGVDSKRRGETLALEEFIAIARACQHD